MTKGSVNKDLCFMNCDVCERSYFGNKKSKLQFCPACLYQHNRPILNSKEADALLAEFFK